MPQTGPFSLVITTYKHARFLERTLTSVWSQSVLPAEIVAVDDASPDETPAVLAQLAGRSPVPMRVVRRSENSGGPARPTNQAVGLASYPVVAILEGDDLCPPGRLQTSYDGLNSVPTGVLAFGLTTTVRDNGVEASEYAITREEILALSTERTAAGYLLDRRRTYAHLVEQRNVVASFSNMMFKRDAFDRVGGIRERYQVALDLDFVCRCLTAGDLVFVDHVCCVHQLHGGNFGGASWSRNRRDLITFRADHFARPLIEGVLPERERNLKTLLLAQAYWESRDGLLPDSLQTYRRAFRAGASPWVCLKGAAGSMARHFFAVLHTTRS